MNKEELIDKYVSAHAECRGMDAGELRDLLNQFVEEMNEVEGMKSPFTRGRVVRDSEIRTIKFRGEEYTVPYRFFRCVESGKGFTDSDLEDDNIWEIVKAYFNRKDVSPFDLVEKKEPTWKDICLIAETIFGMLGKNINDELMGRYDSPKEFYEEVLKKI